MDKKEFQSKLVQLFGSVKEHPFETHRIGFNEGFEKAIQLAIKLSEQLDEPKECEYLNYGNIDCPECGVCQEKYAFESERPRPLFCGYCGAKTKSFE